MEQPSTPVDESNADLFNHFLLLIFKDQKEVDAFILKYGTELWTKTTAEEWMNEDVERYRCIIFSCVYADWIKFLRFLYEATK